MDDSSIQQTPFIKQLAANDRPTRDKALLSLRAYLSSTTRSLPPIELLKLHKGLFYSMWMCDRPLPQQHLASSLASLLTILPSTTLMPFLRAFWVTMSREWGGIDVLRMEKFLLLTRRYIGATLAVLRDGEWEEGMVGEVTAVWEEVAFNVGDMKVANGVRFHCVDVFVDELERVGALEEGSGAPVGVLLGPLRRLADGCPVKAVRVKAREALADERLPGNEK
ncbi:Ribosomal RNA-processing protein-like protein, partial [Lachnellula subtilissima]